MPPATADLDRRLHYAEFYGLAPLPPGDGPLVVVHGNCQAEAIRVAMAASSNAIRSVRIPPVHELERSDQPDLERLLPQVDLFASQPVAPNYRGLPIGTEQLADAAPKARVLTWPVVRYTGLHPYAALVRKPWPGDPPMVPYHDLRTMLAQARGLAAPSRPPGHGRPEGFRSIAAESLAELRRRESAHDLIQVSDLVEQAGAAAMHTINHPGNAVLVPLAARILEAASITCSPTDPGRQLLRSIYAPIDPAVLRALGLPSAAARAVWTTAEGLLTDAEVAAGQIDWYRSRPEVVAAARQRYGSAIRHLGL